MANTFLETTQEPLSLVNEDSPTMGSGSDIVDNFDATRLAFVDGAADTAEPFDKFLGKVDIVKSSSNTADIIRSVGDDLGAIEMTAIVNEAVATGQPEAGAEALRQTAAELSGPEAEWRAIELAVSNEPNLIASEQMAYEAALYGIGKMMAKSSTLDMVGDFGGAIFFSSDAFVDIPQFLKAVGAESFKVFAEQYSQLPPAEKVKQFAAIIKQAEEAFDGNQVKAAGALLALINPFAENEESITGMSYETFEKTFGALELVGWLSTAVSLSKRMNAVRLAKTMNNPELAGRLNKGILEGHADAGTTNVSQLTAAGNTLGFNMGKLVPEVTEGVAVETVKAIERERENLFNILSELKQSNITREALLPVEEQLAQLDALRKFNKWAVNLEKKGWTVDDARIVRNDKTGFDIEYKLSGPDETITYTPKPIRVNYTVDDIGNFEQAEAGIGSSAILSPSRLLEDIHPTGVGKAAAILPSQDKVVRIFDDAMKATFKPLSKQERAKVDDVLLKGDLDGTVYTIKDLDHMGLNDAQKASYYKARDLLDVMHSIKNKTVRDEMSFKGWKSVKIVSGKDTKLAVPVLPVNMERIRDGKGLGIYDGTGVGPGSFALDDPKLAKLLDKGDVELVQFQRPVYVGEKPYTFGVVKKDKITDLPWNILQKRPGYVPIVHKGIYYAVKSVRTTEVNGTKQSLLKVERLFDDKAEADKFAKEFMGRNPEIEARVLADGELTADDVTNIDIVNHGGLYGTPRTDKDILFGTDGASALRVSAVDAMARNMSHVANRLPMNMYRLGNLKRFTNTYGKYLERAWDWQSAFRADTPMQIKKGGEAVRTFIKDLSRIPTPEEVVWGWHVRKIGEFLQGKGFSKSGRYILNLSATDPWAALRAMTFQLSLGMARLDQLFVQSAGASVAMSIHPTLAPGAVADYMAVRAAFAVRHNPGAVANIEALTGYKKGSLVQLVEDFDKSGLHDSIRNNSDYNAATLGLNIDAGMVHRITELGLIPFKEGELFTQGIAWTMARTKYMKDRKLTKLSDADLDNVYAQSKVLALNLTRANRAKWQKGFWSLPTQFWQIQAKFFEQMTPAFIGGAKDLDGAAKGRVWMGQILFFGAAGIPFFKYMLNNVLEQGGYDPTQASAETKAWVSGGLAEFLTQAAFGQRFDVAGRMSIPSGVEQTLRDIFVYDTPVTDAVLGATGSIPSRAFQAFRNTAHILKDPTAYDWNWDLVSMVGSEYATVIASYNNYHRARTWYEMGKITDNQGRTLDSLDPDTMTTLQIGKALGFTPKLVTDYYDLKEWSTNLDKFNKEKVQAIRNLAMVHITMDPSNPVNQKNYDTMMAVILADVPSENDRKKIVKEALAPMFDKQTALNKVLQKYLKNAIETGQPDSINGAMSGSVGQSSVIKSEEPKPEVENP